MSDCGSCFQGKQVKVGAAGCDLCDQFRIKRWSFTFKKTSVQYNIAAKIMAMCENYFCLEYGSIGKIALCF